MSLIYNERTKLLANAFDRASTACVTVGLLAPIAALLYGAAGAVMEPWTYAVLGTIWILVAGVLHMFARIALGGLKS